LESDDEIAPVTLNLVEIINHCAQSWRQVVEPGGGMLRQFESGGTSNLFPDRNRELAVTARCAFGYFVRS
jgi:hypothetical protein